MNLQQYPLIAEDSLMNFKFISEGPKGEIHKIIEYQKTFQKDLYNLAFGDLDIRTGQINDLIVSNNHDRDKVLATVVASLYRFTDKYPDAWVHAAGSTPSRTRLYQMGITKYLIEIQRNFELLGYTQGKWETFEAGMPCKGFLVTRKMM